MFQKEVFKIKIIVLIVLQTFCFSQSNKQDTTSNISISFNIGYTSFALDELNNIFNQVVDTYRQNDFPIQIQRQNPGNIIFDISAGKDFSKRFAGGLRLQYTWTRSFSNYSDRYGNIDIISRLHIFKFDGFIQLKLSDIASFQACAGFLNCNYVLNSDIRLNDVFRSQSHSELSFGKLIPSFEILFVLKYKYDIISFNSAVGFRGSSTSEVDLTSISDGSRQNYDSVPLKINLSGLTLMFGVGLDL